MGEGWDEVNVASEPTQIDLSQLKRKWAVYSPGELKQRSHELGDGRFLIDGLFPERSLGLVIGDSGLGKSPLLYQAAICVAMGTPFLGHPVRQGRVLYLDYENGLGAASELITRLSAHLGLAEEPEDLLLWNLNDSPPKWDHTGYTALDMIREVSPALVIIDSLSSYCPEIEEKNGVAIQELQSLRKIIRDCGTTIIGVHHLKKPSDNPQFAPASLQTEDLRRWFLQARGARALINSSDVRLGVDHPDRSGASNFPEEVALVLRGFGRVRGEIPLTYLARVRDEDGEPLGYRRVTGESLLFNSDHSSAYSKLPDRFRFKEAQDIYNKGAQATTDFLNKCCNVGILRRVARGLYEKIAACE